MPYKQTKTLRKELKSEAELKQTADDEIEVHLFVACSLHCLFLFVLGYRKTCLADLVFAVVHILYEDD